MKKYIKEITVFLCQIFMFYVFPFFGGPTDAMGVVVVIIFSTLLLSLLLGIVSSHKLKYIYPVATALVFIPTVMLHYNESAFIHTLWYLVISCVGLFVGSLINVATGKIRGKNI